MKVTINDIVKEFQADIVLAEAMRQCDIPTAGTAVAVNDKVVPKSLHGDFRLSEGDKIVVIKAFYGG